jgi:hypothetical protein
MLLLLYPRDITPLDRRLGGFQSLSMHSDNKNLFPERERNPNSPVVQPIAGRCTD